MDRRYVVTVSGPPGSGTSTLATQLVEKRDYELISGGDAFRALADERAVSLQRLTELAEEDASIDKELDRRLEQTMADHVNGERGAEDAVLVVESRLAGWFAPDEALRVWIDAPLDVRASRIEDRAETVDELRSREASDARRYEKYYDIDITSREVYDIVVDTERIGPDAVAAIVLEAVDAVRKSANR